ncbi:hypothetical protein [Pseudomonas fluorescens]|uniref:hypothetical protein n=1 Tax=Pseudomonas fluorescens TaxID=294 RepID=UPI0012523770|nr:hypothetical protein [Pseudomonas fluorescens]VVO11466.1 hypothetical protein PS720_03467 [Pseudomonas fluorescens]
MDFPAPSMNAASALVLMSLAFFSLYMVLKKASEKISFFWLGAKASLVGFYVGKKDLLLSTLLIVSVAFSLIAAGGGKLLDLDTAKSEKIINGMPTDFMRARMREFLADSNFNSSFWFISLLPGVAGLLNYMAFSYYRRKVNSLTGALKKKTSEIDSVPRVDIDYLFEIELKQWLRALGLDEVVRATVFRDEGVKGKFSCFARYCYDEDYKDKRDYLYDRVGLLAIACKPKENGVHLKLPDPRENEDAYIKYHAQNLGLSLAKAQGLRMKSRCYIALPIRDTKDTKNVGVLVLEALSENGLVAGLNHKLEKYGYLTKLSFLMELAEVLRPKLSAMKGKSI